VVISKYLSTVDELADVAASTPYDDDPFASLANPAALGGGGDASPFQLAPTTSRGSYADAPPGFPPPDMDPFPSRPIHDVDGPTGAPIPSRPVSRVGAAPSHRISALDFDNRPPVYIGGVASVLRIVAAFTCLGLAIIMVINGEGLRSAWPYGVMVLYGAGALWGLLTARQNISVRQFGIEMAVLAVITVGLRLASPETFAIESSGASTKPVATTRVPDTPLGRFTTSSLDFLESTGDVLKLEAPVPKERWETLSKTLDFSALKVAYDGLDTEERARACSTSGSGSPTSAPSSPACWNGTWSPTPMVLSGSRSPRSSAAPSVASFRRPSRACDGCKSASAKSSSPAARRSSQPPTGAGARQVAQLRAPRRAERRCRW
jgi:hypothetical protein